MAYTGITRSEQTGIKEESTLNVLNLSPEQWDSVKGQFKGTSYGDQCQFWQSENSLMSAQKRIAINGSALRRGTSIESQVVGKIPTGVKKGQLCILSSTVLKNTGIMAPAVGKPIVKREDL